MEANYTCRVGQQAVELIKRKDKEMTRRRNIRHLVRDFDRPAVRDETKKP